MSDSEGSRKDDKDKDSEKDADGDAAREGSVVEGSVVEGSVVEGSVVEGSVVEEADVPAAPKDAAAEIPAAPQAAKEEIVGDDVALKPSYTLRISGVPDDVETSEIEMRLARFGEVVSVVSEDGVVVAKFQRTTDAYSAREKLNGSTTYGSPLKIEFGPQDADHYNRGKQKMQARGRGFLDGNIDGPKPNKTSKGMRSWQETEVKTADAEEGPAKRRRTGEAPPPAAPAGGARNVGPLETPSKPASRWKPGLPFEEQLEDFMKMPRRGMYNRYLVLGKLPPELRTGEAIWRMMMPVQRDIIQIEMLKCFGKPVAHVSLRSATAAAAMHRLCEQMHQNLTVAFAPPRRASSALWLGNVDDYVSRKELEAILLDFGEVPHGMRYLPARTCAFVKFSKVQDAIEARNTLYGLEVQRNQYLNVDFVDEAEQGYTPEGWGAWPATPWAQPWGGQWGARGPWGSPWGAQARVREDPRQVGGPWALPPPPRPPRSPVRLERRRDRHRSRSRGRRSEDEEEESPPRVKAKRRANKKDKAAHETAAKEARSESEERPQVKAEPKVATKAKVKLFKMGEFCCNIVANYVKGKEQTEAFMGKLAIDQRTKIDHCKSHLERAGALATVWHFSAADRKDCAAYDALCDYFVEKQRVGLVQTPACYVYIVPPTEKYLNELGLPNSNFVVGLQIPIKK